MILETRPLPQPVELSPAIPLDLHAGKWWLFIILTLTTSLAVTLYPFFLHRLLLVLYQLVSPLHTPYLYPTMYIHIVAYNDQIGALGPVPPLLLLAWNTVISFYKCTILIMCHLLFTITCNYISVDMWYLFKHYHLYICQSIGFTLTVYQHIFQWI